MLPINEIRKITLPPLIDSEGISASENHIKYDKIILETYAPKSSEEAEKYLEATDLIVNEARNNFLMALLETPDTKKPTWKLEVSIKALVSWQSFYLYFIRYYTDHFIDYTHSISDTIRAIKGILVDLAKNPLAKFIFQLESGNDKIICVCGEKEYLKQIFACAVNCFSTTRFNEQTEVNLNRIIDNIVFNACVLDELEDNSKQSVVLLDTETYLADHHSDKLISFLQAKERLTAIQNNSNSSDFSTLFSTFNFLEQKIAIESIDKLRIEAENAEKENLTTVCGTSIGDSILVALGGENEHIMKSLSKLAYILHQPAVFGKTSTGVLYDDLLNVEGWR